MLAMGDIPLDANDLYALFRSVSKNGDFSMAAADLASASYTLNSNLTVRLDEYIPNFERPQITAGMGLLLDFLV